MKLELPRRLTLVVASLAIISMTAGPVMAAVPTVPTGDTGDVAGSGATFPVLLYRSWMATFSRTYAATFDQQATRPRVSS